MVGQVPGAGVSTTGQNVTVTMPDKTSARARATNAAALRSATYGTPWSHGETARACFDVAVDPGYVAVCLERLKGMGLEPRLDTIELDHGQH